MLRTWATEYRTYGMSLISLLLVISFVFIPVRCDASTAPHSIFVSPTMLNQMAGHQHHTQNINQSEATQSFAHHSPLMLDADSGMPAEHQHTQSPATPNGSDTPAGEPSPAQLANGSDPGSQQPMGATLDLPPASVTADSNTMPRLEQESDLLLFGSISILRGITTAPTTPPPQSI